MAGKRPGSFRICSLAAAFSLAAGAVFAAPAPVQAQGLFDFLGSIFRGAAPRAYNREAPRLLEGFPGLPGEEGYIDAPAGGPHVAYCVRTCDGRYFPLPASSRGQNSTPVSLCSAMCPSAQTKVYSGNSIEGAVANDGKRYKELKNAFVYRERIVSDCSCNGRDTTGIAAMDAEADPTLRVGDIVVTAEGPKVFRGDGRTPHKMSDFVPAEDYRGLPKGVRQSLSEMRVAPERLSATVKTGTSAPAPAIAAAPTNAPALTMVPDGGDAMRGQEPASRN